MALAVAVLLVVILGGKGKLPAGLKEFVEKIEAGPGVEQTDDSEETAGVDDGEETGDEQTDGSEEMTKLSLHFQEVIYKAGLSDARVFLTSGYDNPDGETVAEFITQTDGTVQTELAAGEYGSDGEDYVSLNFFVDEEEYPYDEEVLHQLRQAINNLIGRDVLDYFVAYGHDESYGE